MSYRVIVYSIFLLRKLKKYIDHYRKAINPPYSRDDLLPILATISIFFLLLWFVIYSQSKVDKAIASVNLVANPSFEAQSGEFPTNWQIRTNLVWDGTTAHSGQASLKGVGPTGYEYTFQGITLKPNTTYTASVWVKTQEVNTQRGAGFRYIISQSNIVIGEPAVKGTTDWTLVSKTFKTPANYKSGRLDITYELNQGAIAWFDDATVCEGSRADCEDIIAQITPTVPTLPTPTTVPPTPIPTQGPTATPTPTPIPVNEPTLIASYVMRKPAGTGDVPYGKNLYFPRQFKTGSVLLGVDRDYKIGMDKDGKITDVGAYNGWDFYAGVPGSNLDNAVTLHLNRGATLAVVWRGGSDYPLPNWLSTANGWIASGTINAFPVVYTYQPNKGVSPVYRKSFPDGGEVTLGGLVNPGESLKGFPYWVLLAEEGGQPSQTPTIPSVPSGLETPLANAKCPTWVHDQYKTAGPDGMPYRTWHSIVDPVYWCTFGHDHGANPKLIAEDYINAFEYTAQKHGMGEGHPGFKNLIFDQSEGTNKYRWLFSIHLGTAGRGRLCVRFHTVEIAIKDLNTNDIVANLRFMGDFGFSRSNNNAPGLGKVALKPAECADQEAKALADGSGGRRDIPVLGIPGSQGGYEPWTIDLSKTVFGFLDSRDLKTAGIFLVNQVDTIMSCGGVGEALEEVVKCKNLVPGEISTGSNRFYQGAALALKAGHKGSQYTDLFCTDPLGRIPLPCGDSMAIAQYIKPGITLFNRANRAMDFESFGRLWFAQDGAQQANRENAIIPGVGPN